MRLSTLPTFQSHVYNIARARRLIDYIREGGVLSDEPSLKASLEKAKEPRAAIESRREGEQQNPLGLVAGKVCLCCKKCVIVASATYCDACNADLRKELYHLKRAYASQKPHDTFCKLCNRNSKRPLHFDHSHLDGKGRGWICNFCNSSLGLVEKDARAFETYCFSRFKESPFSPFSSFSSFSSFSPPPPSISISSHFVQPCLLDQ